MLLFVFLKQAMKMGSSTKVTAPPIKVGQVWKNNTSKLNWKILIVEGDFVLMKFMHSPERMMKTTVKRFKNYTLFRDIDPTT